MCPWGECVEIMHDPSLQHVLFATTYIGSFCPKPCATIKLIENWQFLFLTNAKCFQLHDKKAPQANYVCFSKFSSQTICMLAIGAAHNFRDVRRCMLFVPGEVL